ncbi:MAG: co-chaperone GroES [Christensenellaceae bacterium]|nr:co-chaperone GroES [Christensenellaceae bacterium]
MEIKPLFDRVLAKYIEEEETAGGFYIPQNKGDKVQAYRVVAVGDVESVKVLDKIFVAKYAAYEVSVGEEKLALIKESDILAVER